MFWVDFLLNYNLLHKRVVFVLISITKLLNDFDDEGCFALEDEILDPGVEMHSKLLKGYPS